MSELQIGDTVYITDDVLDYEGSLMTTDSTGKGVVVGFIGWRAAVVQWGSAGDYRYADVPLGSLRKYETRSKR